VVSFRGGRLAVTPVDLDAATAARLKDEIPGAVYEPGRSQLSVRVPEDPGAALPRGRCAPPTRCWPSRASRPERRYRQAVAGLALATALVARRHAA
jgi:hypothetical protein